MNKAQEGDRVTVIFRGVLGDGSLFGASGENDPLTFVLGESQVLPGLELAVVGMQVGEQKTVTVPPEEGYGVRQPGLIEEVAIEALPRGLELQVGTRLEATAEDGSLFHLLIIKCDDLTVTLDANHPLAGHPLTLQVELLAIDRPTLN